MAEWTNWQVMGYHFGRTPLWGPTDVALKVSRQLSILLPDAADGEITTMPEQVLWILSFTYNTVNKLMTKVSFYRIDDRGIGTALKSLSNQVSP